MTAGRLRGEIAVPLSTAPGDSGQTTLLVDAHGVAIGGLYGAEHRERAAVVAEMVNRACGFASAQPGTRH